MKYHIFGGGTVSHVRPHLALAAPAYGGTARRLAKLVQKHMKEGDKIGLHLTKMASRDSLMETNADVEAAVQEILADPAPAVIFFSVAMCDFNGEVTGDMAGDPGMRLKTSDGMQTLALTPAEKVIGKIRKERKDIFLVGFKTVTAEGDEKAMFEAGLNLLKKASCNLVLVNDLSPFDVGGARKNLIVTPEVAPYGNSIFNRQAMLEELVEMTVQRAGLSFSKTNVLTPEAHPALSAQIKLQPWREAPEALQKVVDFCAQQGAYKPFNGVTVGHFGWRERFEAGGYTDPSQFGTGLGPKPERLTFWSSRRKKDFNKEADRDLVKVEVINDHVRAWGAKPSAGARSQAQVFKDHPDYDCVVHFHCWDRDFVDQFDALSPEFDNIPHRRQQFLECGSHQCGKNTSDGMKEFDLGEGVKVKAVMLEKHGPNILFRSSDDPQKVIDFIKRNFNFDASTSQYL